MSKETLKIADTAIIIFGICNKTTLDRVPCWTRNYLTLDLIIFAKSLQMSCVYLHIAQSEYYGISALNNLIFFRAMALPISRDFQGSEPGKSTQLAALFCTNDDPSNQLLQFVVSPP